MLLAHQNQGKARREALRTHGLSANLLQMWPTRYDRGDVNEDVAAASVDADSSEDRCARAQVRAVNDGT